MHYPESPKVTTSDVVFMLNHHGHGVIKTETGNDQSRFHHLCLVLLNDAYGPVINDGKQIWKVVWVWVFFNPTLQCICLCYCVCVYT